MEKALFMDTHAHLDDKRFSEDLDAVVTRAKEAGLKSIITVGCWKKGEGFGPVLEVLKKYPDLWLSLGVHPHEAKDVSGNEPWNAIKEAAAQKGADGKGRLIAIGETGLDFHYDHSPRDVQKKVFARQIELARELNLPVIVHSREADKDTIDILKSEGATDVGGVFHCFSGTKDIARQALDMGFYLSFTGVVTFPKADEIKDVVKYVPIEKMLIETDCPYLAPAPHRGKRNEPAFVVETAKEIARLKGLTIDDVARITTKNAQELFGLSNAEDKAQIAYPIRKSLYLNITNRCSNHCSFCAKFSSYTVKGHYLRLRQEPTFAEVIAAVGPDPEEKYDEVVFCGFGEPTMRLDLVLAVAEWLRLRRIRSRLDTNGHGGLLNPDLDVPAALAAAGLDAVTVSLNAATPEEYDRVCRPVFTKSYRAVLRFAEQCLAHGMETTLTAVDYPGADVPAVADLAAAMGLGFRARGYAAPRARPAAEKGDQ